jgi:SPFH domain / Band 7 family/Hsp70 protein
MEILVIILAAALIFAFKSVFRVRENQRAGVTRFGRFYKVLAPGLHMTIPFIDQVQVLEMNKLLPEWRGYSAELLASKIQEILLLERPLTSAQAITSGQREQISWTPELNSLVSWLVDKASRDTGINLAGDELVKTRLAEQAQKTFKEITENGSYAIDLPFIAADASGPKHFHVIIDKNLLREVLGSRFAA